MRLSVLIAFLVLGFTSFSQGDSLPKFENDTLTTRTGYKITADQKLKIGVGTMPDGDFKFIRISATSLFRNVSNNNNSAANQANSFTRNNAGLEFNVVRIDTRGKKKNGFVYYPIINQGITRYEIDIENAIASGEIVVPDQFKPKPVGSQPTVIVKQEVSVADEIAKLKKLYDDGVLSKDEYEAQKKKLLEKN